MAKKKFVLKEETIKDKVDQAEKLLDNPVVVEEKGQIEKELDRALEANLEELEDGGRNFTNVLFVGEAGTGKTARVFAWAKANDVNIVLVNASSMDDTDLGGVISKGEHGEVVRLATTEMDELGTEERSVLFLDEYNRAPQSVRASLLTLIQDHVVRDDRVKGKRRFLPNFLFTIAAINPDSSDYDTDRLDDAEMSRFKRVDVYSDPNNTWQYLHNLYAGKVERAKDPKRKLKYERKLNLVDKLLKSKKFKFDSAQDKQNSKESGNGLILTARTLTNLLQNCDGTKEDFLNNWNNFCNSTKKSMVEGILANYQDVDDKANDALKGGTESEVFAKRSSTLSGRLKDRLSNMG